MLYWIGWSLSVMVCFVFGRWSVIGRDNIPRTGGVLLCGNHTSYIDPPALGAGAFRRVHFMAKEPLFRVPLLGFLIRRVGAFPVKQHSADRSALRTAVELLRSGEVVGLFPEGTRNPNPEELMPPEPGVGMIAMMSQAVVIPVALINTHRLLPPKSVLPHFARVKVVYGKPLSLEDLYEKKGREAVEEVGKRIMAAIDELLKSHATGKYQEA